MTLTDEEKLALFQKAVKEYVDSIENWADVLTVIAGMTKTKFKNFIQAKLDSSKIEEAVSATSYSDMAEEKTQRAAAIDDLKSEIDST